MVKNNVIIIIAVLFAFSVYSGIVKFRDKYPYMSLLNLENTTCIECALAANPAKSDSSRKSYTCTVSVFEAEGQVKFCKVKSQASGRLCVSIPQKLVDSLYSGHLGQGAKDCFLCEKGARLVLDGFWNSKKNWFEVSKIHYIGYNSRIAYLRAKCRFLLKKLLYTWGNAGGLVLALLSGSREFLDISVADSFRKAGLSHLLALSGMHLSFFACFMKKTFFAFAGKKCAFVSAFCAVCFFVWFAGFSPSLFRAFLFTLIMMMSAFFYLIDADAKKVLAFVFLLHSAIRPDDFFSVSFILSYASISGILFLQQPVNRYLVRSMPPFISDSFATSLSAQLSTMPVTLLIFGSAAPIGVISTLIVSPLVTVFMAISVIGVIFSFILPFLSPVFSCILNILYALIVHIVHLFAHFPLITLS